MSLEVLPTEILSLILSFCDMKSINSVSLTCKTLNQVTASKFWRKCMCDIIVCKYLNRNVLDRLNEKGLYEQISFTDDVDYSVVDQDRFVELMKKTSKMSLYYSFNNEKFDDILKKFGSNARMSNLTELEINCNTDQYETLLNDHFWDRNSLIQCKLFSERVRLLCTSFDVNTGEICYITSDNKNFVFTLKFLIHFDTLCHQSFNQLENKIDRLENKLTVMFKSLNNTG